MKKTFELTHPKIKYDRLLEGVRRDVNKYIKRERRKQLPEGVDFWDFDCKFGRTSEDAEVVHLSAISKHLDEVAKEQLTSFYIEILAKEGRRTKKPTSSE